MNFQKKLAPLARVIGIASALPSKKITNDYFVETLGLDTSDTWIKNRTGIESRYICDQDETASSLAYQASLRAIKDACIDAHDIDLILVATSSGDYNGFPSVSCLLQDKLGLKQVPGFDISAACSGFAFSLTTASSFILSGMFKTILVVGVDVLSKFTDFEDRGTCILFGDGAGAALLQASTEGYGVLYSKMYSDGSVSDSLIIPSGGSNDPVSQQSLQDRTCYIKMEGKSVFKFAISVVVPAIKEALDEQGLTIDDVDYFVCHQANKRILDYIADSLSISDEKMVINIDKVGNTSAASIPLALSEINSAKKLKKGNIILLVGFGAGFTWGVNILKWG